MKPTFLTIAGLVAATLAACGGDDPVEAAGTYPAAAGSTST